MADKARWKKEAKEFLEQADDHSLDLEVIISYGCKSQTGEGFSQLVDDLLNGELVKKKAKSLSILDTSYLYRHVIPEFEKYKDPNVETVWHQKNKDAIARIQLPVTMKSWATEIDTAEFRECYKKILVDH